MVLFPFRSCISFITSVSVSLSRALVGTSKRLELLVYENSPTADGEVEKIVCENLNIAYK